MPEPSNIKTYGVIDLGSNTFHLLIARIDDDGRLEPVFRRKVFTRLSRNGLGPISEEAFRSGLEALKEFRLALEHFRPQKVRVIGTEKLRLAPNGAQFVREAEQILGYKIEVISGKEEAYYIYLGVSRTVSIPDYWIMDIGGGSVEFILVKNGSPEWMQSFPVGIAVLYFERPLSDPAKEEDIRDMEAFLAEKLKDLFQKAAESGVEDLVGASGVTDVFFDILHTPKTEIIEVEKLLPKLDEVIHTTLAQRQKMDEIPKFRKKMIVAGSIFLRYVLKKTKVKRLRYSPNSLKEGVLYSMVKADK